MHVDIVEPAVKKLPYTVLVQGIIAVVDNVYFVVYLGRVR